MVSFAGLASFLASQSQAKPAPKAAQSACGLSYLPLVEGHSWTYEPVNQPPAGAPPANLIVNVTRVTPGPAGSAEIALEEVYRGQTVPMKATCTTAGLVLPPESFFFMAEPGGAPYLSLSNVEREGVSFPIRGLKAGAQWLEEVRGDVIRPAAEGSNAAHGQGRFELERLATVQSTKEVAETGIGSHDVTRLEIEVLGRGIVGEKSTELTVRNPAQLWFAPRIGVVRARDVAGREWQIIETNVGRGGARAN
jgi:hypothetical protein